MNSEEYFDMMQKMAEREKHRQECLQNQDDKQTNKSVDLPPNATKHD